MCEGVIGPVAVAAGHSVSGQATDRLVSGVTSQYGSVVEPGDGSCTLIAVHTPPDICVSASCFV